MYLQKGLGKGFVMPLLATAMIASGAKAALVTISVVFSNNTTSEKEYDFNKEFTLTSDLGNTCGQGSLAILVTDIRGGGAYVKSVGTTSIFSNFVNNTQVASLTPPTSITASPFGQGSYSAQFTPQNYGVLGNISDIIKSQLKFILSAGDQAVISSTFEVVAIPTPGALALICIAGGFGLSRRRRVSY
jgi:hypothetical protein